MKTLEEKVESKMEKLVRFGRRAKDSIKEAVLGGELDEAGAVRSYYKTGLGTAATGFITLAAADFMDMEQCTPVGRSLFLIGGVTYLAAMLYDYGRWISQNDYKSQVWPFSEE